MALILCAHELMHDKCEIRVEIAVRGKPQWGPLLPLFLELLCAVEVTGDRDHLLRSFTDNEITYRDYI